MENREWIDQSDLIALARHQGTAAILEQIRPPEIPPDVVEGRVEFLNVEDGLFCSFNEWKSRRDLTDRTIVRNSIGLQFVKTGEVRQSLAGHGRYLHSGARVCLTTFPAETRQVRHYAAGMDVLYVGAWVAPDLLIDKFGLAVDRLPEALGAFFRGRTSLPVCVSLPLAPRLWMALDEIFANRFEGKLREAYLKAKMTELMCETVSSLGRIAAPRRPPGDSALSYREMMQIEAAAMIHMRELSRPPTTDELARRLGLNRNKINRGFRDMFGCTPHEYSKRLRMDWARRLIEQRAMSLSEIADAVGYADRSSFMRAYTDHFGRPPTDTLGAS